MRCPHCGTVYPDDPDANFCELDGTRLVSDADYAQQQSGQTREADSATVPSATGIASGCAPGACVDDGDGYCATCGRKMASPPIDGEIAMPPELAPARFLGAVTDRGKRHPTNQDAVAVTIENASADAAQNAVAVPIIVICDGVSSARHSEVTAAEATRMPSNTFRDM